MFELKTIQHAHIKTDQLVLGNYKYGRLANAYSKPLFFDTASIFGLNIKCESGELIGRNSELFDRLSFYNFYGRFGSQAISYERPFIIGEDAILSVDQLLSDEVEIRYTEKFRKWTLSRLSKMQTIGNYLSDITTIRLLKDSVLSFHGAAFEYNGNGYVITAFPDTGKSYTMMRLLEDLDIRFVAEDILTVDPGLNILPVPFTQTIEKRKPVSGLRGMKNRTLGYWFKDNHVKSDIFEACGIPETSVSQACPLKTIFFLKRGEASVRVLDNKEENLNLLIDLNDLEFNYWRNDLVLTWLFFQPNVSIYDFKAIERRLIQKIVEETQIIEVTAPNYDQYYQLIEAWLDESV